MKRTALAVCLAPSRFPLDAEIGETLRAST
jgi:hypothetical protein